MRKSTLTIYTLIPLPACSSHHRETERDEKRAKEWGGSIYNSARKVAAPKIARKRPALYCLCCPFFCCAPLPLRPLKSWGVIRALWTHMQQKCCAEKKRERPPWIGKRRGASFCGSHNERHGTNTSPFTGNRWLLLQRVTRSMGEPIQPDLPIVWSKIEKHWDELAQRPVIQSRLNAR